MAAAVLLVAAVAGALYSPALVALIAVGAGGAGFYLYSSNKRREAEALSQATAEVEARRLAAPPTHCEVCGNELRRARHRWEEDGKQLHVCPHCNRRMESARSKTAIERREKG